MQKRIYVITALFIASLLLSACGIGFGRRVIRGSGDVVSETREVSGFDRVRIEGAGELYLTQGETEALSIEAEDNIITEITSKVENNVLIIGFEDKLFEDRVIPTEPIKFYLTVIALEELNISGAARVVSKSLNSEKFELDISGAADINIDSLTADSLDVNFSGGAECDLSGEVSDLTLIVNGAGSFDASDLESTNSDITINGAAEVSLWVTEELDISINGAGSVRYYGNPQVSQNIEGIGSVRSLGEK
ncbi:MAG: DUF2807 domain-containing protein [Anaerolineaceae bacterium]|nr:DUF2807 domain-containing protein [Anaerolineaceae bacterium]